MSDFIKKYAYWINAGKFTAIQKFATLGMGVVSFMFLARLLGPTVFGIWGLFLLITSIVETARVALIKNAYIRFIHQNKEIEHLQIQRAAFLVNVLMSLLVSVLLFGFSQKIGNVLGAPALGDMLRLYALTFLVSAFFTHLEVVLNAQMNFKVICAMYLIRQASLLLLIFFSFLSILPISTYILSIYYLIGVILGLIVGLLFRLRGVSWCINNSGSWLTQMWSFGKIVFANNIFSLLFRSTDNFLTSRFLGTTAAGYYNSCLRIGNLVDIPSQVFGDILYPKAAKYSSSTNPSEIKNIYEKTVGVSMVFSIPVLLFIIAFPEFILKTLAGNEFIVATSILRITAVLGFLLPFLKQFGTIMDATGTPKLNLSVMFLAFILNVIFNIIGIYSFGFLGAAFGTLATYIVIFCVSQMLLFKRFRISVWSVFYYTIFFYKALFTEGRSYIKKRLKPTV